MVGIHQGTETSKVKMVRYKEKAKQKLHVEVKLPSLSTNKYGVRVGGMLGNKCEVGMPPSSQNGGVRVLVPRLTIEERLK